MSAKLAALHTDLDGRAVVLDDRRVPGGRGTIDHVVVAPSGVWLVSGMSEPGRVERRDRGRRTRFDERLIAGGRDRTDLVDQLDRHVQAVEGVLGTAGLGAVPVHAALCFVGSTWGWFAKPFALGGVWVTWPEKLVELVLDFETMAGGELERVARVASDRLRTA